MVYWATFVSWTLALSVAGLAFAYRLAKWVLAKDPGDEAIRRVGTAIREGSNGFFKTQYTAIGRLALAMSAVLFLFYLSRDQVMQMDSTFGMALLLAGSFLAGAALSAFSGFCGMWVSIHANVRVASAARRSYRESINICLRGGAFAAMMNVALVIFGISFLFALFANIFVTAEFPAEDVPVLLVGFGFGASFVALFAQLGGGIYTKAADVGADLVGKLEQNIPEDDPRNPAVIADLVGDNVGDCAGRGADLFESISAEIIAAMILGSTMSEAAGIESDRRIGFIMFPLAVHLLDLLASGVGVMTLRFRGTVDSVHLHEYDLGESGKEHLHKFLPSVGEDLEDPMEILKRGYTVSQAIAGVGFLFLTRWLLYTSTAPDAWWHFYLCGLVGMATAYLCLLATQYYTDYKYRPVRKIAEASLTGHATNVIAGISIGMESTGMSTCIVAAAIFLSYRFGAASGLVDADGNAVGGIFGTAVATMGMLSTAVYILSMDVFGPIADNAGGIVEMSEQPEGVRVITDRLDAVGNTTKAVTKGYAMGSAALACFLLFSAYLDEIAHFIGKPFEVIDIAMPEVFVGGLLGAMMVFVFCGWAIDAVGKAAQEVVVEVRRQFRDYPGIMTGERRPDYQACVSIVAKSALREMVRPGALAVLLPPAVGYLFRFVGSVSGAPLLGAQVVAGMMMFGTVTGVMMAFFLNNGGGAWDNAKKYVELGNCGGKGSDAHKAAVTGDTIGDPFKDTAGPSVHVLVKILSTVTLVLGPTFIVPMASY